MSEQRVRAKSERRVGAQRPTGFTRKLRYSEASLTRKLRLLPPRRPTNTALAFSEVWSCLSFVDTFKLWSEGVYDAEKSPSLPAGATA